jgi:hypothetical protein
MKTLVYETKVNSWEALQDHKFAAAEHMCHHPGNITYITLFTLLAKNCTAAGGGHFEQLP